MGGLTLKSDILLTKGDRIYLEAADQEEHGYPLVNGKRSRG